MVTAGALAAGVVAFGGGSEQPKPVAERAGADAGAEKADAAAATVSVAILTEPAGAVVFVDDELAGTSPLKVALTPGRSVSVRAELAGHLPSQTSHVVGEKAETVRLALCPRVDASVPMDAGIDASATSRSGGRRPGGRRPPEGKPSETTTPASGHGSGGFDPENIAQ